MMVFVFYYSI